MDFKKFALPPIFMYIIMGWLAMMGLVSVARNGAAGKEYAMFVLAGGICITVGSALYFIGKKHKYFHAVFHVFVLIGIIVIFCGVFSKSNAICACVSHTVSFSNRTSIAVCPSSV